MCGLSILIHGIISLPDATSCAKIFLLYTCDIRSFNAQLYVCFFTYDILGHLILIVLSAISRDPALMTCFFQNKKYT